MEHSRNFDKLAAGIAGATLVLAGGVALSGCDSAPEDIKCMGTNLTYGESINSAALGELKERYTEDQINELHGLTYTANTISHDLVGQHQKARDKATAAMPGDHISFCIDGHKIIPNPRGAAKIG